LDHADGQILENAGTLWIVATPIGNLGDVSDRARDILSRVPIIAAEDTRTSQKLVPARKAPVRWFALHDHNEASAVERLIKHLEQGQDIALVSDAGTPLISDPGFRLVSAAHDHGIRVSPVPGPSAAIAALSAAGLATDRFSFEGFLPAKRSARQQRLQALADRTETHIFYVPARDLIKVLEDLQHVFGGQRLAAMAREISKQFETIRRGPVDGLLDWVQADSDQLRGECVVLTAGADNSNSMNPIQPRALAEQLAAELPPARAARILTRLSGMPRKQAFELIEQLRQS